MDVARNLGLNQKLKSYVTYECSGSSKYLQNLDNALEAQQIMHYMKQ